MSESKNITFKKHNFTVYVSTAETHSDAVEENKKIWFVKFLQEISRYGVQKPNGKWLEQVNITSMTELVMSLLPELCNIYKIPWNDRDDLTNEYANFLVKSDMNININKNTLFQGAFWG